MLFNIDDKTIGIIIIIIASTYLIIDFGRLFYHFINRTFIGDKYCKLDECDFKISFFLNNGMFNCETYYCNAIVQYFVNLIFLLAFLLILFRFTPLLIFIIIVSIIIFIMIKFLRGLRRFVDWRRKQQINKG